MSIQLSQTSPTPSPSESNWSALFIEGQLSEESIIPSLSELITNPIFESVMLKFGLARDPIVIE